MKTLKQSSSKASATSKQVDAGHHIKVKAYESAYYPKELRGRYEVHTDQNGDLKVSKQK